MKQNERQQHIDEPLKLHNNFVLIPLHEFNSLTPKRKRKTELLKI